MSKGSVATAATVLVCAILLVAVFGTIGFTIIFPDPAAASRACKADTCDNLHPHAVAHCATPNTQVAVAMLEDANQHLYGSVRLYQSPKCQSAWPTVHTIVPMKGYLSLLINNTQKTFTDTYLDGCAAQSFCDGRMVALKKNCVTAVVNWTDRYGIVQTTSVKGTHCT